jgi:hypothetical protein
LWAPAAEGVDILGKSGVRMPRGIWKGAISFGLVHVPVAMKALSFNPAKSS